MRHMHRHGGRDRHHMGPPDDLRGGPRGRRPFDYGALRLIVLEMIAAAPRHGYELMKAIEERTGGGYSPSPGVIYPTLAWLEDMGYTLPEAEGGRKRYRVTPEGEAFLAASKSALDEIGARMAPGAGRPERLDRPEPVMAAMHELKRTLRARFARGPVDPAATETIAAAIRAAARQVETTMPAVDTAALLSSTATVTTPKAAGYAAQLCKHFATKVPAHFEDGAGEITFSSGRARVQVEGETLTLRIAAATDEDLARLQDVVARHLLRFAFREALAIDWQPAA